MSEIMRISTPTVSYFIDDETFDMSSVAKATMYIKSITTGKGITVDNPTIDTEEKSFSVHLSQEQTKGFLSGTVEVQVHIKLNDNNAIWTEPIKTTIGRVIGEDII